MKTCFTQLFCEKMFNFEVFVSLTKCIFQLKHKNCEIAGENNQKMWHDQEYFSNEPTL